jgi:hypothetical protein
LSITPVPLNKRKVGSFLMPEGNARFYESFEGGMLSADKKYVYFIGIIDILTFYK